LEVVWDLGFGIWGLSSNFTRQAGADDDRRAVEIKFFVETIFNVTKITLIDGVFALGLNGNGEGGRTDTGLSETQNLWRFSRFAAKRGTMSNDAAEIFLQFLFINPALAGGLNPVE
jgi:hypothetical protein